MLPDVPSTCLSQLLRGQRGVIQRVGGERAFRRRLLELGLVPGTEIELVGVAPLGDPLKLLVRGCVLSIRHREASEIIVSGLKQRAPMPEAESSELATAPANAAGPG
jgi:Fe2+ transport system protein FeoA